ncbi:MAG: hypothetical protein GF400_09075 [Candidatus Eisenbacteria bacterium]|nr:hypothetical protein [Candidatus Eisenbacteria bacterium]
MSVLLNQEYAWIFLLILAALVFAAFRLYRRVPPSVSPGLRAVLLGLRVAAIAVVVLVLLEPVVRMSGLRTERPVVAVLLDTSRSMAIEDGTGGMPRGREALALLNEVVLPRIAREADVRAYGFDTELERLETDRGTVSRDPSFDGSVTDIPGALAALRRDNPEGLAAVVLATDGANNRGGSVVDAWESLGVPVYALGVGSDAESRDVAVQEVLTNRISYVGEALPIEALLRSSGFAEGATTVELSRDGRVLDRSNVELSETGEESVVRFTVVPSSPGVHRYAVSVPVTPGELSEANNRRVVVTNTLGGRIEALVAAPRPGWDYAFIRRELESDGNVELAAYVSTDGPAGGGATGLPRTAEELLEYDVVVLVEPDRSADLLEAGWLERFVRERGGGLLVLGSAPARGGLGALLPLTGREDGSPRPAEARVRLTRAGETSPLTRLVDSRYDNVTLWESLPPVWVDRGAASEARPDATTLVETAGEEGPATPVVVASRVGAGRVVAFAASGFWRWKMAAPGDEDVFDTLIAGAMRWLTARGDLTRVSAGTDEAVYAAGEEVRLSAQVYRGDYRLARGASVVVRISTSEQAAPVESVTLEAEGDFYRGVAGPFPPARYVFEAEGTVGGESMGTDSGEFVVEEFSLEDAEIRRRAGILRRLADESGGIYVSPETTGELPESVPMGRRTLGLRRELELWNSPWPLLLLVGLLSVEWAIRRTKGMP